LQNRRLRGGHPREPARRHASARDAAAADVAAPGARKRHGVLIEEMLFTGPLAP
jgi:hypothetical protein